MINNLTANAASKKSEALNAYKHMLLDTYFPWTENYNRTDVNKTSRYKFAYVDLNGDKVPELLLKGTGDRWTGGSYKILTYKSGNVIDTKIYGDTITIYKKSKVVAVTTASQGAANVTYNTLKKNGEWEEKLYAYGFIEDSLSVYGHKKSDAVYVGTMPGLGKDSGYNKIYYMGCYVKNSSSEKEVTYKDYNLKRKKLLKNSTTKLKIKWRKNTRTNRNKYLK